MDLWRNIQPSLYSAVEVKLAWYFACSVFYCHISFKCQYPMKLLASKLLEVALCSNPNPWYMVGLKFILMHFTPSFILSCLIYHYQRPFFGEGVLLIQDYNINFMWVGVRLCVNSDNWIAIIILNRKLWIEEENHVLSQLQDIGQVCIQYFITNTLIFIGSWTCTCTDIHMYIDQLF